MHSGKWNNALNHMISHSRFKYLELKSRDEITFVL